MNIILNGKVVEAILYTAGAKIVFVPTKNLLAAGFQKIPNIEKGIKYITGGKLLPLDKKGQETLIKGYFIAYTNQKAFLLAQSEASAKIAADAIPAMTIHVVDDMLAAVMRNAKRRNK